MTQPFEPDVDVDEVTQHHADELRKRLQDEFGADVDAAEIDATMTAALEQLADPADVEDFLPVPAYRYAREQLPARSADVYRCVEVLRGGDDDSRAVLLR